MLKYVSFVNRPIDSVTYVFYDDEYRDGIIIDSGTEYHRELFQFLETEEIDPKYILLTHEHFDHILGVNNLRRHYPGIKVGSAEKASERLPNPKKNLSVFYDQTLLKVGQADIILTEGRYEFAEIEVEVVETPGHTDSSISFLVGDYFITGDFYLGDQKTVTNLPTGSREKQTESLQKCQKNLIEKIILPGHGLPINF